MLVTAAVIAERASVEGLPAAHAAASATVIPWLGAAGAVVSLIALIAPCPTGGGECPKQSPSGTPASEVGKASG